MPYGDWNNAFLAFVAEHANIPADAFLSGASCRSWVKGMRAKGANVAPGSYTPQAGDVAFLSGSRAAVIERVSGDMVQVIEGDVDGAVVRKTYAVSKLAGIGNTRLLMGLYRGTATIAPEEPAKTPADDRPVRTAAPAVKPADTPEPAEEEELTFSATPTPRPGMTSAPRDDGNPLDRLIDTASGTVAQMEAAATSVPTEFSEAFYLMQAEVRKVTERYLGAGEKTEAEIKSFADQLTLQEVYYLRVEMDALETYAGSIGLTAWEGYRFLGWVDQADGVVLSSETDFILRSGGDISVAAVFAKEGEGAWFGVSDRTTSSDMTAGYISHVNAPVYLFDDLGKAVDCAVSGG